MSQGISSSFDLLINRVQDISPKTDNSHRFYCITSADGRDLPLVSRPNTNRLFSLSVETLPSDDNQAGITGRKRLIASIEVRYDIPRDAGALARMIGEDSSSIINTLREPDYSTASTGIISLFTGEASSDPVIDEQGEMIALILNIPFTLLFLEA